MLQLPEVCVPTYVQLERHNISNRIWWLCLARDRLLLRCVNQGRWYEHVVKARTPCMKSLPIGQSKLLSGDQDVRELTAL